jgi:hypothetical protein
LVLVVHHQPAVVKTLVDSMTLTGMRTCDKENVLSLAPYPLVTNPMARMAMRVCEKGRPPNHENARQGTNHCSASSGVGCARSSIMLWCHQCDRMHGSWDVLAVVLCCGVISVTECMVHGMCLRYACNSSMLVLLPEVSALYWKYLMIYRDKQSTTQSAAPTFHLGSSGQKHR